ncbi:MAG: riboflavin synthase [Lachnospiraceae bacterium]|nr:riboflavin synthase [Lachnospiraceae bacterium]
MFTGIIEEIGKIKHVQQGAKSARLVIRASKVLEETKTGDSIAVNGVCLTVTGLTATEFSADVMHETLKRSSLAKLHSGALVNLERAMAADGRFGGHMVAGHVDGMGVIRAITRDDNAIWFSIRAEKEILKYVIQKGSIAVDGISLTVAQVSKDDFCVSVIPHSMEQSILKVKRVGDTVNLENDCIGKYVEKLMGAHLGREEI